MRAFRGRLSPRDQKIAVNKALDLWAATSANPMPDGIRNEIPPKRVKVRRPVDGKPAAPLEREVLADILQALRNDPRVWICDRTQSGMFQDGERFIRVGTKGKLDITLMLKGGAYGEIEVKRPGAKPDERQWRRIYHIRAGGGFAGYAGNTDEALALLP